MRAEYAARYRRASGSAASRTARAHDQRVDIIQHRHDAMLAPPILPNDAPSDRYIDATSQFLNDARNRRDRHFDIRMVGTVTTKPCQRIAKVVGALINISSASPRLEVRTNMWTTPPRRLPFERFTTGLAKEVARDGIRVNCIGPGPVYTGMHASGGEPGLGSRQRSIPMGRGGQSEEVARAILG